MTPVVSLPEPMLRFACNQRGCCCQGWRIPFKPHDLVRLGRYLPPEALTTGARPRHETAPDGSLTVRDTSFVDEAGRCRFLDGDHARCTVHATHGIDALPDICVSFPVASYALDGGVDFFFDPVCPSVLDQLGESDAPLDLSTIQIAGDAAVERRARNARPLEPLRVGAIEITPAQFDHFRRVIVRSLATPRPIVDHLASIDGAYAACARGEPFGIASDASSAAYERFFAGCVAEHGAGTLHSVFEDYRRFIFAVPLDPRVAAWDELAQQLRRWDANTRTWLEPSMSTLAPLLRRYVAHRHFTPFLGIDGALKFCPGLVVHLVGTAFRFAGAFGAVFRRPVDRAMMTTALGASEYVYRSLEIEPSSLPWFGISA